MLIASAAAVVAGRAVARFGERAVLMLGLAILAVSMAMLVVVDQRTPMVFFGRC